MALYLLLLSRTAALCDLLLPTEWRGLSACAKTAKLIEMPFGCGLGWAVGIICWMGVQQC